MEEQLKPLALQVRRLRRQFGRLGLSQAELAERAGVSRSCIQRMEHARALSAEMMALFRVAATLEVGIGDMFSAALKSAVRDSLTGPQAS